MGGKRGNNSCESWEKSQDTMKQGFQKDVAHLREERRLELEAQNQAWEKSQEEIRELRGIVKSLVMAKTGKEIGDQIGSYRVQPEYLLNKEREHSGEENYYSEINNFRRKSDRSAKLEE